jgi:hypothetical protein
VDAIVHASRVAQATHQEEMLAALRNGVLHALPLDSPSLDEHARFFRLVDRSTPAHVHLLRLLDDAGVYPQTRDLSRPAIYMGGRIALVEAAIPE